MIQLYKCLLYNLDVEDNITPPKLRKRKSWYDFCDSATYCYNTQKNPQVVSYGGKGCTKA